MKESAFQASLIRTIKNLLPGCIVLKNDPSYIQGIPDLIILDGVTWACLEVKKSSDAPRRPNQEFYINKMSKMSYASFVYPENVQQVLEDMINHFKWINSHDFTLEEFNEWKNERENLYSFINQIGYQEAVYA